MPSVWRLEHDQRFREAKLVRQHPCPEGEGFAGQKAALQRLDAVTLEQELRIPTGSSNLIVYLGWTGAWLCCAPGRSSRGR